MNLKPRSGLYPLLLLLSFFSAPAFAQLDELYDNAEGSPITRIIHQAKVSIDIEVYQMEDLNILIALQKAVQRGVKLRIVQEGAPFDSACNIFEAATLLDSPNCIAQKKFVTWVRQNRGQYVPFNTQQLCSPTAQFCYQHGKIVIADSKVALISTGNFNPSNFCDYTQHATKCNRDYTVLTRDPKVVRVLGYIFQFDLEGRAYDLRQILSSAMAARLTVSPYSLAPLVRLIQSAKNSILVQNQYLNEPTLNQALIDAAKRGVKVFVNVSSVCYFERPDEYNKNRWTQNFTAFDQAGIQSRMFTVKMKINNMPGYLHAKAILVDGAKLWIGSVNGSTQSLNVNREFGLLLNDSNAIKKFSQKFSGDFKHVFSEDWKESLACKYDEPAI